MSGSDLSSAVMDEFVAGLRGPALTPGDADYDSARLVMNGLIDRKPAVIVRCSGVADVMAAVDFARDNGLTLSVRAGGHNVAGKAVNDGGVVIDLREMRGVRVDPEAHTARVQGGDNFERLSSIKAKYDPTNLFNQNMNIPPAAEG